LTLSRGGELRGRDALVGRPGLDLHEPVALERAQETAHVAGVEAEPGAERANVGGAGADLPEQARLAAGAVAGGGVVGERADALAHDPVEPAYLSDGVRVFHYLLTLVR